ncbi:MAG: flavodoxin-dependent (E)-4-hydroxy-3-methylbut-2-enyl-diphosphate synthase [Victivallales bacterium]|nr:flavodoxin-dependent (E)-4-hydroxy-3-methylbut-2-enyl-diphosphate synthase [Victivallales bacterium]
MATRQIKVGDVAIGGGLPPVVQSMCNTRTDDPEATLAQIQRLADLGCRIIRVAFPAPAAADGLREICRHSPLPVIADIHFDWRLAVLALENGTHGIRINPGNMRNAEGMQAVAKAAADSGRAVRIGVNMGSLSPEAEAAYGRTPEAMAESAAQYLALFEDAGCRHLKVSLKSSHIRSTVQACRAFSARCSWPMHLGITEAGTAASGMIKSAVGIGALLLDGIGDTIRVSLTAPPEEEITAAYRILDALSLRPGRPEIISCPTCGRTRINLISLAQQVEEEVNRMLAAGKVFSIRKIAVMGCEVNGPGEAADADIGIAGGNGKGIIFRNGAPVATLPEEKLLPEFIALLKNL